jgi:3-isopropylmalate/(R)-2-methylmalate dehydratase large subunit
VCYHYDETLGDYPYVGLETGGERPIGRGEVKGGGFVASVSGKRRGKGSSREQSPYAERAAGIQVVVAENIERIYRENCENLGMLATTDFSIVDRIRRGEEIPLEVFLQGAGPIERDVVEFGGLLNYAAARLGGQVRVPEVETGPDRPMTVAEKILARHWVRDAAADEVGVPAVAPGDTGFVRADIRFSHEYVTPMASTFWNEFAGEDAALAEPETIYFFRDHLAFLDEVISEEKREKGLLEAARGLHRRQREFAERTGVRLHGELEGRKGSEAICHVMVQDRYALPGQVIVGSDSHTPHCGSLGAVAFGVGATAIVNSWATRDVRVEVPPSVRVHVDGRLAEGVTAKDLVLEILRHPDVKDGRAIGKVVEYVGPAVEALDVDERTTLTNMAAEIGGFTGIVAPDERTVRWLLEHRDDLGEAEAREMIRGLESDPDAAYEWTLELDGAEIRPMVALPGDPGNGRPVDQLEGTVDLDIVFAGSCTGAKREDMDMYARVLRDALDSGRRVAGGVRAYLQYGSVDVEAYARERGYDDVFREAGIEVLAPGCGACINAGPGVSRSPEEVTISSINRNFPGRSGPGQVYLASPYTVMASAVEGRITGWEPSSAQD